MSAVLVWFRSDLRVSDHPALTFAAETGLPVIPVYILEEPAADRDLGSASKWWLHHSVTALAAQLDALGSRLILRRGDPRTVIADLTEETGATTVTWTRRYAPGAIARDKEIKAALTESAIEVKTFNGQLLNEPWTINTKDDRPYRVYTPYSKAVFAKEAPAAPLPKPSGLSAPPSWPGSDALEAWGLLPTKPDWAGGLRDHWAPGEDAAQDLLARFLDQAVTAYKNERNMPGIEGTSRLSPYLAFGEISPRQVWHATRAIEPSAGSEHFLKELVWREFSHVLAYDYPDLPSSPMRPEFQDFPWQSAPDALQAWQKGQTGFPIVDAGMRELWHTGWMHNRVRMVVASFLVKNLLIPWQDGEAWFWDTLVDADPAQNPANWQWVSGCGADAAPYFRIFNPILQGEKFDPDGVYVRRWVPELTHLPDQFLHKPWEAPELVLQEAGVTLGKTYPGPLMDHRDARDRALAAYEKIKKAS